MHRNLPRTRASLPTAPRAYARAGESGRFRGGTLTLLPPYSACSSLPAGVPRPIASAAAVLLAALLGATLAVLSERSIRARPLCPGTCAPRRVRALSALQERGQDRYLPPPAHCSRRRRHCSRRRQPLLVGPRAPALWRPVSEQARTCAPDATVGPLAAAGSARARARGNERAKTFVLTCNSRRSSLMKSPVVIHVHVLDL